MYGAVSDAGARVQEICHFQGGTLEWQGDRRSVRGAVAQLGERLNGIQEVGGSTPLGSTK
jgi:hypothetical protein